jgi:D-glutamate N-acetyltransferase
MTRRYVVFAPGAFAGRSAKTAHGVIAYSRDTVVAVVDPDHAGKRVRDVVPYLRSDAPIIATVQESLRFGPTSLLIGIAPPGGALPPAYRAEITVALQSRLEVVNGLHSFLNDDAEMRALADKHDSRIWDLRMPPAAPLFSGAAYDVASRVVLTVGSDCAVGKMTAALELTRAARTAGGAAEFVPTGQTGIAIAGWGTSVDRVIADFASGASEQLVLEGDRRVGSPDGILFVEGQGGIAHPGYAPVTLALLYGCAPDALVLVHLVTRTKIDGYDIPVPGYRTLIRTYEGLCANVKPARVAGIALNTHGLDEGAARAAIAAAREQTGLPCDDLVRFGPDAFYAAIAPQLTKTPVLADG